MASSKATINPHRLYTLGEAQELSGISPADLIRLAGASLLNLCVMVPAGRRAYSVDPASVITWDSAAQLDRDVFHSKPNRAQGIPERKDDVMAVVLDWSQCLGVLDHGVTRQVFFRSAYAIEGQRSAGSSSTPLHLRPIRFPLFTSDGLSQVDQSRWRFAIYSNSVQFLFIDDHGYPEPEDILVFLESIYVLGRELHRLPKEVELSPIDVDVTVVQVPDGAADRSDDESLETSSKFEREESIQVTTDELSKSSIGIVEHEDENPPLSQTNPLIKRRDLIQDDLGNIELLTREEVERLIKKGKSWIYERINEKHPRYDPTFPQPIRVGSGIGWIKSEVEAWWQLQIRIGIRKSRGATTD